MCPFPGYPESCPEMIRTWSQLIFLQREQTAYESSTLWQLVALLPVEASREGGERERKRERKREREREKASACRSSGTSQSWRETCDRISRISVVGISIKFDN
jgi:hypothetical protein